MPEISWREFILWLLRQRKRVLVKHRSMLPTLAPGDEVLFQPQSTQVLNLKMGDVVIVNCPDVSDENLIKRIVHIHPDHQLELRGDNLAESTDSRHFGLVKPEYIVGKVTCRFSAVATDA